MCLCSYGKKKKKKGLKQKRLDLPLSKCFKAPSSPYYSAVLRGSVWKSAGGCWRNLCSALQSGDTRWVRWFYVWNCLTVTGLGRSLEIGIWNQLHSCLPSLILGLHALKDRQRAQLAEHSVQLGSWITAVRAVLRWVGSNVGNQLVSAGPKVLNFIFPNQSITLKI